jgi:hypothetical protein
VALLASATLASMTLAAATFQYDAGHDDSFNADPPSWKPLGKGSPILRPVHSNHNGNGWSGEIRRESPNHLKSLQAQWVPWQGSVRPPRLSASFEGATNGAVSPLMFAGDEATNLISYCLIAVCVTNIAERCLPTLIGAPCRDVCLWREPVDALRGEPSWRFEAPPSTNAPCHAILVNGADAREFAFATDFTLVEVTFAQPVPLSGLYIGGAPASPRWNAHWRGGVGEVILMAEAPRTPRQRAALYHFMRWKWGIPLECDVSGVNVRHELRLMGVDDGGRYSSAVIIR